MAKASPAPSNNLPFAKPPASFPNPPAILRRPEENNTAPMGRKPLNNISNDDIEMVDGTTKATPRGYVPCAMPKYEFTTDLHHQLNVEGLTDEILNSPITLPLCKILGAAGEVSKNINWLTKTAKQESPDQAPANIHEARSVAANDEWGDSEYDSDDESENTLTEWLASSYSQSYPQAPKPAEVSEKEHIRAMIDTGSELNLMSHNLQEELRLPLDPAGAAWGIKGASAHWNRGLRFDHIFFVKNGRIGSDYDLLLGQPWLKAAAAEIHYGEVGLPDSMSLRLYEQGNTQGGSLIVNLNVDQKREATALAHFIMQTNEGATPIEGGMPGQSSNEDNSSRKYLLLPPEEGSTREGAGQDTRPTSLPHITKVQISYTRQLKSPSAVESTCAEDDKVEVLLQSYLANSVEQPQAATQVTEELPVSINISGSAGIQTGLKDCSSLDQSVVQHNIAEVNERNIEFPTKSRKRSAISIKSSCVLGKLAKVTIERYLIDAQADSFDIRDLDRLDDQQITEVAGNVEPHVELKESNRSTQKGTWVAVRTTEQRAEVQPYATNASNLAGLPSSLSREDSSTTDYRMKDTQYDTLRPTDNVSGTQATIGEAYCHVKKPTGTQSCAQSKGSNGLSPQDQSGTIAGTVNRPRYAGTVRETEESRYSAIDEELPDNEPGNGCISEELDNTYFELYFIGAQLKVDVGDHQGLDRIDGQLIIEAASDIEFRVEFEELGRSLLKRTRATIRMIEQETEVPPCTDDFIQLSNSSSRKRVSTTDYRVRDKQCITLRPPDNISGTQMMIEGACHHVDSELEGKWHILEVVNEPLDVESCPKFKEISRSKQKRTRATIRTVKQQIETQPYVSSLTELPSSLGAREGKPCHSCETVGTSPNLKRSLKVIDMTNCRVKGGRYITLDSLNSILGSQTMQWDLHYLDDKLEERWHVIEVANKSLGIEPWVRFKEASGYISKPNLKDDLKLGVTVRKAEQRTKPQYYITNNPQDPTRLSHHLKERPESRCSSIVGLSLRPNNRDLESVLGTVSMTSYQVRTEEPTLEPFDKDLVTWKSQNRASYHLNNETGEIETNSGEYESNNKNPKTNHEVAANGTTGLNHLKTQVEGVISDKGSSKEDVSMSEIEVKVLLGPYPESLRDELMLKPPSPHSQVESSNSSVVKKESGPLAGNTQRHNTEVKPERSERSYLQRHVTASQKKSESNKVAALRAGNKRKMDGSEYMKFYTAYRPQYSKPTLRSNLVMK
ncbi:hypothetical protein BS47DRAFT_1368226 [Hydnum rufescens UP504]|uniref:DUF4100 domain-containing protein n=1 Tax=Hydnum rufescens UP504 TaxID=1448309 RepID=A0A9P6AG47_9AGAM|nr:hypothetical protein BS47DRAFT_1368226 [Hydnum rufescens UP504]